jgi:hypothetical protein
MISIYANLCVCITLAPYELPHTAALWFMTYFPHTYTYGVRLRI